MKCHFFPNYFLPNDLKVSHKITMGIVKIRREDKKRLENGREVTFI